MMKKEITTQDDLIFNIEKLHTTEMGVERIKRNLDIDVDDVVEWCRLKMLDPSAVIEKKGKNWYISVEGYKFTVNVHSYTIITAHKI